MRGLMVTTSINLSPLSLSLSLFLSLSPHMFKGSDDSLTTLNNILLVALRYFSLERIGLKMN
jgi:hypothetical protein